MDGGINDRGLGLTVDWREVGLDLRRAGFGPSMVARVLNLPRGTVRAWFEDNNEPSYTCGLYLIRLHARVVSKEKSNTRFAVRVGSL